MSPNTPMPKEQHATYSNDTKQVSDASAGTAAKDASNSSKNNSKTANASTERERPKTTSTYSAWELTQDLVRIDSSNPGAYETEIELWIKAFFERRISALPDWLSSAITMRELEVLPGRKNLMVTLPGTTDQPRLVYICHMDTVVLGDGWDENISALSGCIQDNKLYGRGATDMKSGLACAIQATLHLFASAAAVRHLPERGFSLICTVDEEDFMRGVEAAIQEGWVGSDEWVLDTEPTDKQIQVAHKGRTWFELEFSGLTAHASKPEQGADAIAAACYAITHIHSAISELPKHYELGTSSVTFGQITGGYRPYVVPQSCKVWIDMRLVPPTTTHDAKHIVQKAIDTASQHVPGTHGAYVITGDRPFVERDANSGLLKALQGVCRDIVDKPVISRNAVGVDVNNMGATTNKNSSKTTQVGIFTGYTDTAVIASTCNNRNCMSYGPGNLALAHKPNEWVHKDDVERSEKVLSVLARRVCFNPNAD